MHFIAEFTQQAVIEVFSTMLNLRAEILTSQEGPELGSATLSGMVGSVGFTGKINGTLFMNYSPGLACGVTGKLIGLNPASMDEPEVADLIGEIANMVSGDMKRRTSQLGYNGWLSTPLIMKGSRIIVEPKDAPIAICNRFRIPELNEDLEVRVFAKLET